LIPHHSRLLLIIAVSVTWTVTLVAAPPLASLPGAAGPTVSALVYAAGSLVCHQMSARSFHLGGAQLPVCARCLGLYAGASLGAIAWAVLARGRRRSAPTRSIRTMRTTLLIAAAPTALTVMTAWFGWWDPANGIRFGLAVPFGAAAGVLVAAVASGHLE
jgi:uncharacterized membrane protein